MLGKWNRKETGTPTPVLSDTQIKTKKNMSFSVDELRKRWWKIYWNLCYVTRNAVITLYIDKHVHGGIHIYTLQIYLTKTFRSSTMAKKLFYSLKSPMTILLIFVLHIFSTVFSSTFSAFILQSIKLPPILPSVISCFLLFSDQFWPHWNFPCTFLGIHKALIPLGKVLVP